jgi:hypothetical protein
MEILSTLRMTIAPYSPLSIHHDGRGESRNAEKGLNIAVRLNEYGCVRRQSAKKAAARRGLSRASNYDRKSPVVPRKAEAVCQTSTDGTFGRKQKNHPNAAI